MKRTIWLLAVAALVSGSCDLNITDPNNLAPIGPNPSRGTVARTAVGILIAARSDAADWILDAGIMGREAYRFDGSDPRFTSELLAGPLDPGSGAFGGDHWLEHYAAYLTAYDLAYWVGTSTVLGDTSKRATRGFAVTMQAYSLLMVLNAHTEDSIPVDASSMATGGLAPLVSNDSAHRFVSALLDSADTELALAGSSFPFALPAGFTGFETPAAFRKFNRALKARVEVYRGSLGCGNTCYTAALTALGAAFVDTSATADLNAGVYFDYGPNQGDATNPLALNPQTGENFAHPSVLDSVETRSGGGPDDRYTAKVVSRSPVTAAGLTSGLGWIRYPAPNSPIPIIRNEELILLRGEANNALGNPVASADDINYIRVNAGGLAAIGGLAAQTSAQRLDEILRQRKYSLLYEGHRWVDMRRTGKLGNLLLDRPGDQAFQTLPIPSDECLARATNPSQCP